jgi:hypothetical protein
VLEIVSTDETCPVRSACRGTPAVAGTVVVRGLLPSCLGLPGLVLLTDDASFTIQPGAVGTGSEACSGGDERQNGRVQLGAVLAPWVPAATMAQPASAPPPQTPMLLLYGARVVRYRIAPSLDPADSAPALWRSTTGRFTATGSAVPEPGEAGFTAAGSNWEVVARGIEDLQIEYQAGADPRAWGNRPPAVVAEGWDSLVRQVRLTLSARVTEPGLSGETAAEGAGPNAVRGQLTTVVAPRTAFNELQMQGKIGEGEAMHERRVARREGDPHCPRHPVLDAAHVPGADCHHDSTELQIATNYRWSQQALYNAEAGLEVARVILSFGSGWQGLLPARRMEADGVTALKWIEGEAPPPPTTGTGRDYYRTDCDTRGGLGYGLVLDSGGTRYESQSTYEGGETLNGAFTLWIRRDLVVGNDGKYQDGERDDILVIVSEGVAPYIGGATAFTSARQATRVLETRLHFGMATIGKPCESLSGQEGMGPSGDNYNPCAPLAIDPKTGIAGGLESAFGAAGTGETGSLKPLDR